MFKDAADRAVPRRQASAETRRQILETALALFRERGLDATTMRDIAAGAGLALGAAYYYFKGKEAIVGAYYDYVQHEHRCGRGPPSNRPARCATGCAPPFTARSTS